MNFLFKFTSWFWSWRNIENRNVASVLRVVTLMEQHTAQCAVESCVSCSSEERGPPEGKWL